MLNLILIGMPGAGKSTLGVILAKTLGMNFVDVDIRIQETEGTLLQNIINEKGNDYFKMLEEKVLCEISAENTVISTGGSAIYYPKAMQYLKENGIVVYIDVELDEIERRLDNISTRGITLEKGQTIKDLYDIRVPLYEKYADMTLKSEGMTVEESVSALVKALKVSGKLK